MKNENQKKTIQELGRIVAGGYYDFQEVRKSLFNRVRDIVYRKSEGIGLNETLDEGQEKEKGNYSDDELFDKAEELIEEGKIKGREKEYVEEFMKRMKEMQSLENGYKSMLESYLATEEIWTKWLQYLSGIGPVIGAGLVKYFGYCENYDTVSGLWKHCGMTPNGAKGRTKGEKLEYDPRRKTFVWKIANFAIRMQKLEPYTEVKKNEKEKQLRRMELKEEGKEDEYNGSAPESKGHAEARAMRKAVKIFLSHYWCISRQLKGLDTKPPYVHDKLKHDNYIKPPKVPQKLQPFEPY
ncbi:MAG: hypothetical protein ABEK36_04620 [Candidatus Aenigmatarchaeota archaeon]